MEEKYPKDIILAKLEKRFELDEESALSYYEKYVQEIE